MGDGRRRRRSNGNNLSRSNVCVSQFSLFYCIDKFTARTDQMEHDDPVRFGTPQETNRWTWYMFICASELWAAENNNNSRCFAHNEIHWIICFLARQPIAAVAACKRVLVHRTNARGDRVRSEKGSELNEDKKRQTKHGTRKSNRVGQIGSEKKNTTSDASNANGTHTHTQTENYSPLFVCISSSFSVHSSLSFGLGSSPASIVSTGVKAADANLAVNGVRVSFGVLDLERSLRCARNLLHSSSSPSASSSSSSSVHLSFYSSIFPCYLLTIHCLLLFIMMHIRFFPFVLARYGEAHEKNNSIASDARQFILDLLVMMARKTPEKYANNGMTRMIVFKSSAGRKSKCERMHDRN